MSIEVFESLITHCFNLQTAAEIYLDVPPTSTVKVSDNTLSEGLLPTITVSFFVFILFLLLFNLMLNVFLDTVNSTIRCYTSKI